MRLIIEARLEGAQTGATTAEAMIVDVVERQDCSVADLGLTLSHGDELSVEDVTTISSQKSELVQLADLIAGAVNRKKNHTGESGHKDEMADLIIKGLDIQLEKDGIPNLDATTWISV
jgi:hypothetical protein